MIWLLMACLFLFLGLSIHKFKWYFLISGYNTMSKEKQAKVDVARLGKLMGLYGYFNALLFLLMACVEWFDIGVPQTPFWVLFVVSTGLLLVKAQKYDGNLFDEQGKWRKGAWRQLIVPGVIIGAVVIGVGILIYFALQPLEVNVRDNALEITGSYGDVYTWDSMQQLQLLEELPTIEYRSNGSAVGSHLKGYFKTKEHGTVKLFVDTEAPPFILFESDGEIIIVNLSTKTDTLSLYTNMEKRVQSSQ